MEEKTNIEVNVENQNTKENETTKLVEVESYKKADNELLKNAIISLGAIALAISLYFNVVCYINHRDKKNVPDEEPKVEQDVNEVENDTKVPSKVIPSGNTNPGTVTPTNDVPAETKKEETPVENKVDNTPVNVNQDLDRRRTLTPEEVEASWTTGDLSRRETVTFDYYDAAEEREDSLTRADRAYIQEYIDYYGISYEDARVTYLQNGPLVIPYDYEEHIQPKEPEYATVYVFDADDLATINALMIELDYTRSEAENYYVTVIAPSLGKPLQTEIIMLKK